MLTGFETKPLSCCGFESRCSHLVKLDQKFEDFEGFFSELELSKKNKWLLSYSYNPHKGNTKQRLPNISKGLDELNSKYDNIVIMGDLNSEMSEPSLDEFYKTYNLENIINKPTVSKILRILHPLT